MAVRYDLERSARTRNKLIGYLAEGLTYEAAARAIASPSLKCTPQSVFGFAQRHLAEIDERRRMLAEVAREEWIGEKRLRIRETAAMYGKAKEVLDTQGLFLRESRQMGEETVTTERFNAPLLQQMRGLLRDAAEELGQIERPAQVHNTQINQFLIRQYEADVDQV